MIAMPEPALAQVGRVSAPSSSTKPSPSSITSIEMPVRPSSYTIWTLPSLPASYAWRTEFVHASVSASFRSCSVSSEIGRSCEMPVEGEPAERDVLGLRGDGQPARRVAAGPAHCAVNAIECPICRQLKLTEPARLRRTSNALPPASGWTGVDRADRRSRSLPRRTVNVAFCPGSSRWPTRRTTSLPLRTGAAVDGEDHVAAGGDLRAFEARSAFVPARRPARAPGLSGLTQVISAPVRDGEVEVARERGVRSSVVIPTYA